MNTRHRAWCDSHKVPAMIMPLPLANQINVMILNMVMSIIRWVWEPPSIAVPKHHFASRLCLLIKNWAKRTSNSADVESRRRPKSPDIDRIKTRGGSGQSAPIPDSPLQVMDRWRGSAARSRQPRALKLHMPASLPSTTPWSRICLA